MVVRTAAGRAEVDAALRLRERVFCDEQGVAPAAERDGRDADAIHVVALEEGALVGTCRLLRDGREMRLGRMAVDPAARGRGVGRRMLAAAEDMARRAGARRIRLHAQVGARRLYERAGYAPRGEPFVEEGMEHVTMEKPLA